METCFATSKLDNMEKEKCIRETEVQNSALVKSPGEAGTRREETKLDNKEKEKCMKELTRDKNEQMPEKELVLRVALMEKVHAELAIQINFLTTELGVAQNILEESKETIKDKNYNRS